MPAPTIRTSQRKLAFGRRTGRGGGTTYGLRGLRKSACSVSSGCPLKIAASAPWERRDNALGLLVFNQEFHCPAGG